MEGRPAASRLGANGTGADAPVGGFVSMDDEVYYRISAFHRLAPFLMSIPSNTDLWMFVASGGGLTAGRVDADHSLFPYRTVDQLHDAHHHTGPLTLIRVERGEHPLVLWEPFGATKNGDPDLERNLYKNTTGNRLVFEEVRHDLGLAFRYDWAGCDEFGWVRSATLENRGAADVRAVLLDGLRNILPHGASLALYQQSSNLVDAYKKSEVDPETGLGIYSLTAGITDRAEALEVLRANTVWCCGLVGHRVHLSLAAVAALRAGQVLAEESVLDGARGNYLVSSTVDLEPGESSRWRLVADVGRDHVRIAELRSRLKSGEDLDGQIGESLRRAGENLRRNVGSADGLQMTGRDESWSHHFANVLFNNMRGGVVTSNYDVPVADLADFLRVRDRSVARRVQPVLDGLPAQVTVQDLRALAADTGDADFARLCHEYLPLHFGRRHGDPSRPWNRFAIRVRDPQGERVLNYEGNWRDIFQNWEALCTAFPGFLPSIVAKFVNASTVDGFNPYRITREGVDWETANPDDSWSNIGYWGDHQIIYLLKLLEALNNHEPAALVGMLGAEIYSYAEVPYLIKPYEEILRDPGETIVFDTDRAVCISERVAERGTDGKLLGGPDGSTYHANLLEKLLVPALSKLSNLIPGAGIWMNTQRPEWNDANNALGGGGVSVVTLCYLRRYLSFLADLLDQVDTTKFPVSAEVVRWFEGVEAALAADPPALGETDGRDRKGMMDRLGGAFSAYRETVYARGFSGKTALATVRVAGLCRSALGYVEGDIAANRRDDGLFHTYNLLEIADDGSGVEVRRLQEMLEGQVAVLSSGILAPAEALEILKRLYESDLYRSDQHSFLLYPEKKLPGFLARNAVAASDAEAIPLLRDLLAAGDRTLIARDADGICRFHGGIRSADDVGAVLDDLGRGEPWSAKVERDRAAVLGLFEDVFRHKSYTGRSGVMYGYEGLGCIYWHMVAKLLLAVQETFLRAARDDAPPAVRDGLARMYSRIRAGIGYKKTVAEYGAFPTDPYSHTPAGGGAKQPGMTGQVKEEILTRAGELGVRVEGGTVGFQPALLDPSEFLAQPGEYRYYDLRGEARTIPLPAGSLAFSFCQVPVVYEKTDAEAGIRILFADGTTAGIDGAVLGPEPAAALFCRSGDIAQIRVAVPGDALCRLER